MSGGGGSTTVQESPETRSAARASTDLYKQLGNISREQWDAFKGTTLPLINQVTSEAERAGTPGAIAERVSGAGTDVDQAYDQAGGSLRRSLGRYGLTPGSGRFAAASGTLARGRAADKAGAMTLAGRGAREDATRLRMAAAGMGGGLASSASSGLSAAGGGLSGIHRSYMSRDISNAQSAAQRNAAMWGGLGQLGGAAIGAFALSDPEVKTDVEEIGELESGLKVYKYRFLGEPDPEVGVMADEVEEVRPDAVVRVGGLRRVNYGRLAA